MKKQKQILQITLIIVSILIIIGCGSEKNDNLTTKAENINSNNNANIAFEKTYNKTETDYQKAQKEADNMLTRGEITSDEVTVEVDRLMRENMMELNPKLVTQIPDWAVNDLELIAPTELTLDEIMSTQTSNDNEEEGYNSIFLIYNGLNEAVNIEGDKIIQMFSLEKDDEMSPGTEYQAFSNNKNFEKYLIMVAKGSSELIVEVVDMEQLNGF